jgi:hypothetical protein
LQADTQWSELQQQQQKKDSKKSTLLSLKTHTPIKTAREL